MPSMLCRSMLRKDDIAAELMPNESFSDRVSI